MKHTYYIVNPKTREVVKKVHSYSKAQDCVIQSRIAEDGSIREATVEIWGYDPAELRPANTAKMLEIDIGNGYALSVKNDLEAGVSIALQKNGEFVQDLVAVERPKSELKDKNGNPIYLNGVMAFVWGNEKDKDFTHRITIPFVSED